MGDQELLQLIEQAAKNRVTELNLSHRGITTLPPEIGQLRHLTTLDLSKNQLKALPSEIGQLTGLTVLNLQRNRLNTLPAEIGGLSNLSKLNLRSNKLSTLPSEIGQLTKLTSLVLGSNQFSVLPAEIWQLSNLLSLELPYNLLRTLPAEISQLINLNALDLGGNNLSNLPSEIGKLVNLIILDLGWNSISILLPEIGDLKKLSKLSMVWNKLNILPPEIGQLTKLTQLHLANNQLMTLPPEIAQLTNLRRLDLRNNRLPIPPEILQQINNPSTILEYLGQQQKKPLNEAKLIFVGEGRVGKTSLVRQLVENRFDEKEPITEGIAIKELSVKINSEQIKLRIWDFGGQEIMHATHQFFLTIRSLYILVLDAERGETESRIEYWLKLIQSFGKDSPIIVVSNKSDLKQLFLNQGALQEEYPTIKGFVNTSCKAGKGIDELVKHIRAVIREMKHVRDEIPEAWLEVKAQLEGLKRDYITYDTYLQLCRANNIDKETEQRILVRLLHDLGIVLNFQDDPRLRETSVLNPEWVTGAVYQIINAKLIEQNKGLLAIGQLDNILDRERYPKEKDLFIVDLMRKFELCFDLEGHTDEAFLIPDLFEARILIPDVLPKEEESKGHWPADSLTFEYHYDFLPRSVISRLIVRLHRFIFQESYWLNGVVLVYNQNKALVKALPKEKVIVVSIIGGDAQDKRKLWAMIRDQLEDIHASIKGLNAQVKIRHQGELIDYTLLRNLQQQGISETHIPVGRKIVKVNVWELLEGMQAAQKSVESIKSRALQEILAEIELRVHPQKYYRVAFSLGRLYYEEMGDYSRSRSAFVKTHEAIEALRGMVQEDIQVQLSAESARLYQMLVQCFLVEGARNKAFEYAAVGKGRAFINKLAEASFDLERLKVQNSPFASKLEQARQKREQIDQLEAQIGAKNAKRDDLLGRQSVLLREEAQLWREMADEYPILTATLTVPTLSSEQARHLARELGATLVEYYCHAGGWCAFVVTGEEIRIVGLPALSKRLLKRLIRWRNRVHLPAGRSPERDKWLVELYDAVIEPLGKLDERVIIAPFQELHLVPLAAAYNQRAHSYLAEEHVLSFAPSLTALYVFNQEQKRRRRRLVSKLVSQGKRIRRLLSVAYPGKEGTEEYLPNVLPEAGTIMKWLSKVAAKVESLHEEAATPDNVLKSAPNYDAIHFGCHGSFDSDNPTQSGLLLAGEKAYLTVQDIITQLNLKQTRLVTLAACLSGQVALQAGEEHIGLLQAMMTAGVPTVVASLWSVDDAATRNLFTAFYTRQITLNAPAQAMRDAAALLREKEKWTHPYYWAAFQVNGLTEKGSRKERVSYQRPLEWPPDLLKQIDDDYQRRFTSQRGEIMKDQLFMDNAELLFEDMLSAKGTLAALKQYPLPDQIAGLEIQKSELGLADAIHHIVLNNPTLRQRFLPASARDIKMLEAQLTEIRGRVTREIHQSPVLPPDQGPTLKNDVDTVRKALIEALSDSPPTRDDEDEDDKQNPNVWGRFKAKFGW